MAPRSKSITDVEDPPPPSDTPLVIERIFTDLGDQRYSLKLLPAGVTFMVERLRRDSKELHGELSVSVNGHFPNARTIAGGILSIGDLNFSSVQARGTRAKLLQERSKSSIDWVGFLDEFVQGVIEAERRGKPAIILADEPDVPEDKEAWDIEGLPVLRDHPMVIFGKGSAGKSYLAMWLAGSLAERYGLRVLYSDWEFSIRDHRKRLGRLFAPMPKTLWYVRCDRPIKDEIERLTRLVHEHRIDYIVCDSIVFALAEAAEGSDQAGVYFRALRQLGIGSLNLAHVAKGEVEEETPFGSVFFENGARSVWYIHRATNAPQATVQFGLFHRKTNIGELLRPKGFEMKFTSERTAVARINLEDVDELAAKMPLLDRAKKALNAGAMTHKALGEALGVPVPALLKVIARHQSTFIHLGPKIGLASSEMEF